jgi:hypothetical protein
MEFWFIFVRLDLVQNNQKKFLPNPQTRVTRSGQSPQSLNAGSNLQPEVKYRFEFQIISLEWSLIPSSHSLTYYLFEIFTLYPPESTARRVRVMSPAATPATPSTMPWHAPRPCVLPTQYNKNPIIYPSNPVLSSKHLPYTHPLPSSASCSDHSSFVGCFVGCWWLLSCRSNNFGGGGERRRRLGESRRRGGECDGDAGGGLLCVILCMTDGLVHLLCSEQSLGFKHTSTWRGVRVHSPRRLVFNVNDEHTFICCVCISSPLRPRSFLCRRTRFCRKLPQEWYLKPGHHFALEATAE